MKSSKRDLILLSKKSLSKRHYFNFPNALRNAITLSLEGSPVTIYDSKRGLDVVVVDRGMWRSFFPRRFKQLWGRVK